MLVRDAYDRKLSSCDSISAVGSPGTAGLALAGLFPAEHPRHLPPWLRRLESGKFISDWRAVRQRLYKSGVAVIKIKPDLHRHAHDCGVSEERALGAGSTNPARAAACGREAAIHRSRKFRSTFFCASPQGYSPNKWLKR